MKKPENHGVPYSLTEEFTSVYRMHSLLPDQLQMRDIDVAPGTNKSLPLIEEYITFNLSSLIFPVLKFTKSKIFKVKFFFLSMNLGFLCQN